MKRNHNPSPDEDRSKETDNIDITEPSTSTATYVSSLPSTSRDSYGTPEQSTSSVSNRESQESARKSSRDSKFKYLMEPKKAGGGGKDSGHGFAFHWDVTKLMLFELRELCNSDPEFQFKIWLEKAGYGKFDDIVLRYKKSDKWVEICIQCKHGEEKIGDDGTKTVKSITAEDLLSLKNKQFSLLEYIHSFIEVEAINTECEKYYVILTNREYGYDKDSKYPFFQHKEIVDLTNIVPHGILINKGFRIIYNTELGNHFYKEIKANKKEINKMNLVDVEMFCKKFVIIHDSRNLNKILLLKCTQKCENIEENVRNLDDRLLHLSYKLFMLEEDLNRNTLLEEINGKQIIFNVREVYVHFTGRVEEIKKIEKAMHVETEGRLFNLLVTGMAGIGKTQLVLKYIKENGIKYKHIVWINAESKDSVENSFGELAKECQIDTDTRLIYSYFCKDTLFVFDNAENVIFSRNDSNKYLYLPNDAKCIQRNKFIIISQSKILKTKNLVEVLKFSTEEALQYLDATSIECNEVAKRELAEIYQCWPLALCLATSYIKLRTGESFGQISCSDVIETLKTEREILFPHSRKDNEMLPYSKNLQSLWQQIKTKLLSVNELALKIIEILSFSDADNFPLDILQFEEYSKEQVLRAASFLRDNSLITAGKNTMSIHRTLQSVIRDSINSDSERRKTTLLLGTKCFMKYLESLKDSEKLRSIGNIHMVTFVHHLIDYKINVTEYIEMASRLQWKLIESGDLKNHCRSDGIFDKMVNITKNIFGSDHTETCKALHYKAIMLKEIGKYNESLDILNKLIDSSNAVSSYNQLFEARSEIFCKWNPVILMYMNHKANVLHEMGEYKEALLIHEKVMEARTALLGTQHPNTISSMNNKANVLHDMGDYNEALIIYDEVIEARTALLGTQHPDTISSMNNKATVLHDMGDYNEALIIHNEVIEAMTALLGTQHPDTISSMNNKATVLHEMGDYKEALIIYNEVIEAMTALLGTQHPNTMRSMNNKANVLQKMGDYNEALIIYNEVIKARTALLGTQHPVTISSMNNKANVLQEMGDYNVALIIYNDVIKVSTALLGTQHPDTISIMNNKANVLQKMGDYNDALSIHNEVIEAWTALLGPQHPNTLISMNNKANVLHDMGNYELAFIIHNEVFEARSGHFGSHHPETLRSMHGKAEDLGSMGKCEEAIILYNKVIEARSQKIGIHHPRTLLCMHNKATILHKMGTYEEALTICNQVFELRKEKLGENHPDTLKSLHLKTDIVNSMEV